MNDSSRLLTLWRNTSNKPGGKKVFSRLVCTDAPWFASVRPVVEVLEPGHVEVSMRKHRAVTNRLGQIHAMAMCSLAQLTGSLLVEVALPTTYRWSLQGISADYFADALTDLTAISNARLEHAGGVATDYDVDIEVRDLGSTLVCRVRMSIRVEANRHGHPRKQAPAPRLRSRLFHA